MPPSDLRLAVRDFLEEEAQLLDDNRLLDWLALFDPDGVYWVPVDPAQAEPGEAPAHVHEERLALEARVRRLLDPRIVPQMPRSRTCRVLGRVTASEDGPAIVEARARFITVEARATHDLHEEQRTFAGLATYRLVRAGGTFRIRRKRVDLVNSESGLRGVSILL